MHFSRSYSPYRPKTTKRSIFAQQATRHTNSRLLATRAHKLFEPSNRRRREATNISLFCTSPLWYCLCQCRHSRIHWICCIHWIHWIYWILWIHSFVNYTQALLAGLQCCKLQPAVLYLLVFVRAEFMYTCLLKAKFPLRCFGTSNFGTASGGARSPIDFRRIEWAVA